MKIKNVKKTLSLMLLVLFLFSFVSLVLAWGVAPARQFANYNQNTQKLSVNLINNDGLDGYFKVSFAGQLAKYAKYDGGLVYLLSDQGSVNIPFTLTLPNNLDPGKNTLAVVLEQVNSEKSTTVGASLTLVAEVVVSVPVQGEFVNVDVIVSNVKESNPVPITISLFNTGTESVPVWAEIKIKDPRSAVLETLTTEKVVLDVGQSSKFEKFWTGDSLQGSYYTETTVHYGSSFKTITNSFIITGDKVVSEYVSSENFKLGQISPVEIGVKNDWNEEIEGVFSEVFVLTKTGDVIQSFKSGPEDILPRTASKLFAYWDTSKLLVGNYDLNVVLHYAGETSQKTYPAVVSLDELQVISLTGQVTGDPSKTSGSGGLSSTLVLLLVILIAVNIIGMVIMRKAFLKKK